MKDQEVLLRKVLAIGLDTSLRGEGISLREALARIRYNDLRPTFGASDLVPILQKQPSTVEQWILYSEDKRTSGGWYLMESGEIGQITAPRKQFDFASIEEAVANYVVRELDFWAGVGDAG